MLPLTVANVESLLQTIPLPKYEFYIVKDLCNGKYFINTFYVMPSRHKVCMAFLLSDVSLVGADAFMEGVLNIIPSDFVMRSTVRELLGNKLANKLFDSTEYKPCENRFSYDSSGVVRDYWDLDVLLHYCSEHESELTETGKKFYDARKNRVMVSKELIKFDPASLAEKEGGHKSIDGQLTLNFD